MSQLFTLMILAGGRSSRFGSDKALAKFSGGVLINYLLDSIPNSVEVVVVGPVRSEVTRKVKWIVEAKKFGGPVSGISNGLDQINSKFVGILATDMPFGYPIISDLLIQINKSKFADIDVLLTHDQSGFPQPLCAVYKTTSLVKAVNGVGMIHGISMKKLLENLKAEIVENEAWNSRLLLDIDSFEDLAKAESQTMSII